MEGLLTLLGLIALTFVLTIIGIYFLAKEN